MPDIGLAPSVQHPAASAGSRGAGRHLRAALGEPLVHFVGLAVLLFITWPLIASHVTMAPNVIVISSGQVQRAVEVFAQTHLRPPNAAELSDLAEQEVQEEVFYREGMALGLDRDDEIIRRRIQQKLKFMVEDVADRATPSDAELQRFLDSHPADFVAEPKIAFSQVYLNPVQHAGTLREDAARMLARLNSGDGRLEYGTESDVLPVPNDFEATPQHVIASMFGDDFAATVVTQTPGKWLGPVASGYGQHLVLVRQQIAGQQPKLSEIRDAVLREWQTARREQANADAYRQLRSKYRVRIDLPSGETTLPPSGL